MSDSGDGTVQKLRKEVDHIKRLWQQGDTLEMPGHIERARSLVSDLEDAGEDGDDSDLGEGCRHRIALTEMIEHEEICARIREDASERFSPLPDGSEASLDEWNIEYWVIEDNVLHYRVSHPDFNFKSEVKDFAV